MGKNRDISKECNCEESLKKQKWNYESSKKENAYNKKQSASILQERQQQINDLVQQVNSLNDFKFNSIKKSDHEKVLQEYNKLKVEHSELQQPINEAKQINSVAAEPSNSN